MANDQKDGRKGAPDGLERQPETEGDKAGENQPRRGPTGEIRSFDPKPRKRAGEKDDGVPVSPNEGRLGPAGDPVEGKP